MVTGSGVWSRIRALLDALRGDVDRVVRAVGEVRTRLEAMHSTLVTVANNAGRAVSLLSMINTHVGTTRHIMTTMLFTYSRVARRRARVADLTQPGTVDARGWETIFVLRPLSAVNRVCLVDANGPIIYSAAGGCRPFFPCHVDTEDNAVYLGAVGRVWVEPVQGRTVTVEAYYAL